MSGSLNKVQLIGRLTREPEMRYTNSGVGVCALAIATNRYGQNPETGERKEMTDYHDVVVWNSTNRKLADICNQWLQKGRLIYVEGRLQTRSWDDQQTGQKRYKTEVVASDVQFLESKGSAQGGENGGGQAPVSGATLQNMAQNRPAPQGRNPNGGGQPQPRMAPTQQQDAESELRPEDIPF